VIGCKGKTFPGDAEPSAEWTDSQHIRIAIAVLSSVVEKHETVNELSVSYELGPVLAEACDWSKSIKGINVPTNSKADNRGEPDIQTERSRFATFRRQFAINNLAYRKKWLI
jgi:hypothetical protein